jgi:hypothetical protein
MSRTFDRQLKRTKQQLMPRREPEPDFTGWNPADVMLWKINNGGASYEELVRRAMPSREEQLRRREEQLEEERERKFLARERMVAEIMGFPEAGSEPKPEGQNEQQEPEQPEPEQPKQWWEERAHWRRREPRDYYWEKAKPAMCLVEYDPLAWDNDYDPLWGKKEKYED